MPNYVKYNGNNLLYGGEKVTTSELVAEGGAYTAPSEDVTNTYNITVVDYIGVIQDSTNPTQITEGEEVTLKFSTFTAIDENDVTVEGADYEVDAEAGAFTVTLSNPTKNVVVTLEIAEKPAPDLV